MGPIVCATRGGKASRRTQEQAIALAHERGDRLIFLFIADTTFTRPNNQALAQALTDELERLGSRLLCIAQARAHQQGIEADMVVRHGPVREAIENFLREVQASTLILGAPQAGSAEQIFAPGEMSQFAQEIHAATGVEVIIVG